MEIADKLPAEDESFRGQIAVGEGAVWVAALDDETVVRVDPRSGQIVKTIPIAAGIEGDIAAAKGAVWVIDEANRLVRIDPRTKAIAGRPLPVGAAGITDLTVGGGAAWIAGDIDQNTVTRIAP